MTSFNPNHLPKAPYPKTNTGVVVFQHMNLHAAHNIHLLSLTAKSSKFSLRVKCESDNQQKNKQPTPSFPHRDS